MKSRMFILAATFLALVNFNARAQDTSADHPLLRLLRFIPDTPANRQWVAYGDVAAWHESWNIPRIQGEEAFDALDRVSRAYLDSILPDQITPGRVLGNERPVPLSDSSPLSFDFFNSYGFDYFSADRFVEAGIEQNAVTVAEFSFEVAEIGDTLSSIGYEPTELDQGVKLYSLGDVSSRLANPNLPPAARVGFLNFIALLDNYILIARSEQKLVDTIAAYSGQLPSLADDSS